MAPALGSRRNKDGTINVALYPLEAQTLLQNRETLEGLEHDSGAYTLDADRLSQALEDVAGGSPDSGELRPAGTAGGTNE